MKHLSHVTWTLCVSICCWAVSDCLSSSLDFTWQLLVCLVLLRPPHYNQAATETHLWIPSVGHTAPRHLHCLSPPPTSHCPPHRDQFRTQSFLWSECFIHTDPENHHVWNQIQSQILWKHHSYFSVFTTHTHSFWSDDAIAPPLPEPTCVTLATAATMEDYSAVLVLQKLLSLFWLLQ